MTASPDVPTATLHLEVRHGGYQDSVRLMQVGQAIGGVPGVSHALVAMATVLNLELAAQMGFRPPTDVTANDLLVAIASNDEESLRQALARLELELAPPAAPAVGAAVTTVPPRTVGSAIRRTGATLAVVSTPGEHAFVEAMDAVQAGASVMVFSDNVPVWQEIRLKDTAAAQGVLVMGPDCGTAVLGGVGIGFANVVRPGPVGLVAASGTGAQQVMCLLDAAGVGISHCLGVGGRDLSTEIAGRSTLAALDALDADPATELIVLVSKPPAAEVADVVRAHAAELGTPVVVALLGSGQPDLTAAVTRVLGRIGRPVPGHWPAWLPAVPPATVPPAAGAALRGLFAGGTLADEAMLIASAALGPIRSNIPLRPEWALPRDADPLADGPLADGHWMVDFGADELTRGRPHPMIDNTLRLRRLAQEAADPAGGTVLLDVVLGHAADPDPAAVLAPAIAAAVAGGLAVVVSLTGTDNDPQDLNRQAGALRAAGAAVFRSNADAARHAVALVRAGASEGTR
ncbi:MAG: FdrA family protein [Actinobacteria bacterium]|nr:FdrA family protein [Actinomycetota bacterium]